MSTPSFISRPLCAYNASLNSLLYLIGGGQSSIGREHIDEGEHSDDDETSSVERLVEHPEILGGLFLLRKGCRWLLSRRDLELFGCLLIFGAKLLQINLKDNQLLLQFSNSSSNNLSLSFLVFLDLTFLLLFLLNNFSLNLSLRELLSQAFNLGN